VQHNYPQDRGTRPEISSLYYLLLVIIKFNSSLHVAVIPCAIRVKRGILKRSMTPEQAVTFTIRLTRTELTTLSEADFDRLLWSFTALLGGPLPAQQLRTQGRLKGTFGNWLITVGGEPLSEAPDRRMMASIVGQLELFLKSIALDNWETDTHSHPERTPPFPKEARTRMKPTARLAGGIFTFRPPNMGAPLFAYFTKERNHAALIDTTLDVAALTALFYAVSGAGPERVRVCYGCYKLFFARDFRSRFCSRRCLVRVNTRKYRHTPYIWDDAPAEFVFVWNPEQKQEEQQKKRRKKNVA